MFLLILISAAAILIIRSVVINASLRQRLNKAETQLSLGSHYLNEMDYEAAVVAFETVLKIDEKNTTAYMGLALAYEGTGNQEKVIETLEQGKNMAGGEIYEEMLRHAQNGERLRDIYGIADTTADESEQVKLKLDENPFNTLNILGSSYYDWDIISCAQLFDFDYEQYMGKNVDLGWYQNFSISFEGSAENPKIEFANNGYTYSYEYQEKSLQQIFRITGYEAQGQPSQLKEFGSSLKIGMTYEEIMNLTGLSQLAVFQENIYYIADSNLGQINGICWRKDGKTLVRLSLSSKEGLSMNFIFHEGTLKEIVYVCSVPDNLRSKAINWLGDIF